MKRCEHCQKGSLAGGSHRHHPGIASHKFRKRAPGHKRVLKANLHWARIKIAGQVKKMLLCAKCTKKLKKLYNAA